MNRSTSHEFLSATAARLLAVLERQPLVLLAFAGAALMGLADIAANPKILFQVLGDTDDAARLHEVRELIAGRAWFDMTLPRFGGADPLVSHWSRLIDLPLALLIVLSSAFVGEAGAETFVRMAWPTLLSGVIAYVVARFAQACGGRRVALLALALAIPCTGHFQFTPGRIDHHNVMIICAVSGIFLLVASLERPVAGWLAGALLGLGCVTGFEGLPLTLAALAVATLAAMFLIGSLEGAWRAAVAFAATLAAGYLLFGPGRPDGLVVCDALSVNLIALAAVCAVTVLVVHVALAFGAPVQTAFVTLAIGGVTAIAIYGAIQPVCLGGPYAQVAAGLGPVWLDHVSEVRSLFAVAKSSPMEAASFVGYPALAAGYGYIVVRGRQMPHAATYFALFLIALALGLWQVRLLPYASYLSVPLIAAGLLRRADAADTAGGMPKLLTAAVAWASSGVAGSVVKASVILVAVVVLLHATNAQSRGTDAGATASPAALATSTDTAGFQSCTSADNIKPLAALAPGLAVNDIDLGSYLVVWTRLSVSSAPYHRMGRSILATHALLHAPAGEAADRMKRMGARYVVLCKPLGDTVSAGRVPKDALRSELLAGRAPAGLEPVAIGLGNVQVWRLAK